MSRKSVKQLEQAQLSHSFYKFLAATNVIERLQIGVEKRTHSVMRWANGDMLFGGRWITFSEVQKPEEAVEQNRGESEAGTGFIV